MKKYRAHQNIINNTNIINQDKITVIKETKDQIGTKFNENQQMQTRININKIQEWVKEFVKIKLIRQHPLERSINMFSTEVLSFSHTHKLHKIIYIFMFNNIIIHTFTSDQLLFLVYTSILSYSLSDYYSSIFYFCYIVLVSYLTSIPCIFLNFTISFTSLLSTSSNFNRYYSISPPLFFHYFPIISTIPMRCTRFLTGKLRTTSVKCLSYYALNC